MQDAGCDGATASASERAAPHGTHRTARIVNRVGYIKPYPTENPTHRQAQAGDDRKRVKTLQVHARGSCPVSRGGSGFVRVSFYSESLRGV